MELTFEEFCEKPFQYCLGIIGDAGAKRMYRNEDLKVQKEVHTKRKKYGDIYGGWKDPVVAYFLDGDDREFSTPDAVYVAYMEKVCGIKSSEIEIETI
jgi:hypothetical protein